jgi:hypothetical protein
VIAKYLLINIEMKVIRLNENDIENLVNKILKEDRPRGGMLYGEKSEIVDEVVNRIGQYGDEYIYELEQLNNRFPSTKYKKIHPPTKTELPKGVKVQSTVYPNR